MHRAATLKQPACQDLKEPDSKMHREDETSRRHVFLLCASDTLKNLRVRLIH